MCTLTYGSHSVTGGSVFNANTAFMSRHWKMRVSQKSLGWAAIENCTPAHERCLSRMICKVETGVFTANEGCEAREHKPYGSEGEDLCSWAKTPDVSKHDISMPCCQLFWLRFWQSFFHWEMLAINTFSPLEDWLNVLPSQTKIIWVIHQKKTGTVHLNCLLAIFANNHIK